MTTEAVSPEREAANEIADRVFRWTRQVLTVEDRDEIEGIVRKANAGLRADLSAYRYEHPVA